MQFIIEPQPIPDGEADALLVGLSDKEHGRSLYAVVIRGAGYDGEDVAVAAMSLSADDDEHVSARSLAHNIVACLRMADESSDWKDEAFRFLCRHSLLRLDSCLRSSVPEAGMLAMMVTPEDSYFFEDATDMIIRFCLGKLAEETGT
jgi:hypothetical protein